MQVFNSPYPSTAAVLIYTGLGLMGRELINIRSCDIVMVAGGQTGTLGEFAIAFEKGKLIGVLEGTGGITAFIESLEQSLIKETNAEVIYDDPDRLTRRLLERYARLQRSEAAPEASSS